jgi:magnesium-transporting ATPase (P-type)
MKGIAKILLFVVAITLFVWYIWIPFVRSLGYEQLISIIMGLSGALIASLILYKPTLGFFYTQGYLRGLKKGQN